MAKRFTETKKWEDPWFQDLDPAYKCVWFFILDHCDNAGVWVVNTRLMAFQVGKTITWESVQAKFGKRLMEFAPGKIWVPKFIEFQYGSLSEACKPHQKIIGLLKSHTLWEVYTKGIHTLQEEEEDRDKEKEEEEDKDKEEEEDKDKEEDQPNPKADRFDHPWLSEPAFIPAWRGWIEMRVQKRNKPTELAKKMAMTELQTLCKGDMAQAVQIVNHATLKGWLSFYAIKEEPKHGQGHGSNLGRAGKTGREFPESLSL
jgi:hypothetical protein